MKLKIKKLREQAKLPTRGTAGSAGMDLYACIDEKITINPGDLKIIPTGIAIALPDNSCAAYLYARSGLGVKHGICLSNGVGVIDADYRGELLVSIHNHSSVSASVAPGQRIAQLVIMPVACPVFTEADALSDTDRGAGGFGSTGR